MSHPELPSRLTLLSRLNTVITARASSVAGNLAFSDGQKALIAAAGWFCVIDPAICPLPLDRADSFRVLFASGQDESPQDDSKISLHTDGDTAVAINLYRDGSPFVYDKDLEAGVKSKEYTVLIGQEAPPTMVHQEHLEHAAITHGGTTEYAHGSWRDMSVVMQTLGREYLHLLSDQDCQHLLTGVVAAKFNALLLVTDMSSVEGFADL